MARSCGHMPTRAPETNNLLGHHYHSTIKPAVTGWWPLPKTEAGKSRPDLWKKTAGHVQIALYTGRRFALP
jgi:hypothetical protein